MKRRGPQALLRPLVHKGLGMFHISAIFRGVTHRKF